MSNGFWDNLKKPVIGLAPMDGVTDAAFRFIMDTHGHPDLLFTEFTSVEGIVRGVTKLLEAFIYHKTKTPTIAQVFGANPEGFYKVAFVLAEMGFNGVDINMGCPDKDVAKRGGGAGLILEPKLAQEIVRKTRQGLIDWAEGRKIEAVGLPDKIIDWVKNFKINYQINLATRSILPVSVKTRIGYDKVVTKWWMETLLEAEPANISLHGRTLKQMYSGLADWDEIALAAEIVGKTKTTLLGNGDIKSHVEALEKIKKYKVDGVLIGRATYGNPWVFQAGVEPTKAMRFRAALDHVKAFVKLTPNAHFISLRKHMAWYCRGFEGAPELRNRLVRVNSVEEVENILYGESTGTRTQNQ